MRMNNIRDSEIEFEFLFHRKVYEGSQWDEKMSKKADLLVC